METEPLRAAGMPFAGGFRVASPFGLRTDPITGEENVWHGGVDLVGPDPASMILAAAGGTVLRSRMVVNDGSGDRTWEWGNYVSVLGDDGVTLYYCHLAKRIAAEGDRVEAGQPIGIQGSTGRSLGNHLHFEARRGWVQIDPCAYLGIPNEAGFVQRSESGNKDGTNVETGADPAKSWEAQASPWAREAVGRMISLGILRGRGGGEYGLHDAVTREEVCVMIDRAMGEMRNQNSE